jgi:hypothetical protein
MKLNGNISYPVNGINGNRNGFLLLTNNPNGQSWGNGQQPFNAQNFGAYSLLHLMGDDSPNIQEGGYRHWMRTGITFTSNNDLMYVGHRKEAVIS